MGSTINGYLVYFEKLTNLFRNWTRLIHWPLWYPIRELLYEMKLFWNWKCGKLVSNVLVLLAFISVNGGITFVDHVTLCLGSSLIGGADGDSSGGHSTDNFVDSVSSWRRCCDLIVMWPFLWAENRFEHETGLDEGLKPFVSSNSSNRLPRKLLSGSSCPSNRPESGRSNEDGDSRFRALASSSNKLALFFVAVFWRWMLCWKNTTTKSVRAM
jgi:hypothetical protein